jgi:hypothetical protein
MRAIQEAREMAKMPLTIDPAFARAIQEAREMAKIPSYLSAHKIHEASGNIRSVISTDDVANLTEGQEPVEQQKVSPSPPPTP